MPVMLFRRLEGREGTATIRGLGSRIGELVRWSLTRRGDDGPDAGLYNLRAEFSFLVPALLLDHDYNDSRELLLSYARGRNVRVKLDNPERMALTGKVLVMEGVEVIWQ